MPELLGKMVKCITEECLGVSGATSCQRERMLSKARWRESRDIACVSK